jgi:phosphoserine phosphatase
MRVFIVRHGETDWNVEGRIQGITDIPLNANGLEQAQKIANRLRLEPINAILASPLSRAKKTAEEIAKYHPQSPIIDFPELAEVSFGEAEGLTGREFITKYPRLAFRQTPQEVFVQKHGGGESMEDKVEKLLPKVRTWKKQYRDKSVVVSTHGLTKKCLLIAFEVIKHEEIFDLRFGNTSLTIIKPFDIDQIELLNDTSHL